MQDACKALGRPLPQVQAMVTREPDLLLLGARIFNNRLKVGAEGKKVPLVTWRGCSSQGRADPAQQAKLTTCF